MTMNKETYRKRISELQLDKPRDFIFKSFAELTPCNDRLSMARWIVCGALALFFSYSVFQAENPQDSILACLSLIIDIDLGIFGIIATIFSIVFIFINSHFLEEASEMENGQGVGAVNELVAYYSHLLCLYSICLTTSIVVFFITRCTNLASPGSSPWYIMTGKCILFSLYLTLIFRLFAELRSAVYNLILLANTSMALKYEEAASSDDAKDNE